VNNVNKNVITAEDPVELIIPGIIQVEINEKAGVSYAKALRHMLRQDPDVIMIGEIRDKESAQLIFEAALTDHLFFSTIHTNNFIDVISRLKELELSESTIANRLIGVLSERLLPKLCEACKERHPIREN
jgi:type IV pilus assembly protein PilB